MHICICMYLYMSVFRVGQALAVVLCKFLNELRTHILHSFAVFGATGRKCMQKYTQILLFN